jgi:acyl carrier protein
MNKIMRIERQTLLELLQTILRELGEDLGKETLLQTDERTPLFGSRSDLDSMNLVNIITEIEERLSDDYDINITLASSSAMSRTRSPFLRVGSCVDYILELIEKQNNE